MAKLERTYNIPLRKGFVNVPRYKRAKKASTVLRKFIMKHMKSDDVKIGQHLNKHIWKHGIKNPPHHVTVNVVKDDDGVVKAELEGFEFKGTVMPEEAQAEEGLASKLTGGALGGKKEETKEETTKPAEGSDKKEVPKEPKKEEKAKPAKKTPAKKAKPAKKSPAKKTSKK